MLDNLNNFVYNLARIFKEVSNTPEVVGGRELNESGKS